MTEDLAKIMRFAELTDSTLPVGGFAFSNSLETAADMGLVYDYDTLEQFVENLTFQSALSDGVAALHALRAYNENRYDDILTADSSVILCKMNAEARTMTQRMGRKLAELMSDLTGDDIVKRWTADIFAGHTPGTYPVAQAIAFAICGLTEQQLLGSHLYGVASTTLNAALRCVKVSHYQTQKILFRLCGLSQMLYHEVRDMEIEDMNYFSPQMDILASMHEKGTKRMFMN